ncbi:hypothetical protein BU16DRAFT_373496 [Lophium mytilinum]|uniref:Uncharacterized protein n=1 Tax=Lophium mytilinum TaxID=390894 RepID=A0A6A6QVZ9_9PEZI|nr:hypothetical protein BU16DRAFT_373496 [Lophium mytilinum]
MRDKGTVRSPADVAAWQRGRIAIAERLPKTMGRKEPREKHPTCSSWPLLCGSAARKSGRPISRAEGGGLVTSRGRHSGLRTAAVVEQRGRAWASRVASALEACLAVLALSAAHCSRRALTERRASRGVRGEAPQGPW